MRDKAGVCGVLIIESPPPTTGGALCLHQARAPHLTRDLTAPP